MSSEKFETLEDDLNSLLDGLKPTQEQISLLSGEQRKNAVRQAERKIEEANFIVQEMENEAKSAPISYRSQMLGRLRNYKRDIEQVQRNLKKGSETGMDNYGFDSVERLEASQRGRLIQGTQSLNRAGESIARSHQIAAETDEIGVEVIGELGRQREVLGRTRDRLIDTDANLGRSRKILKNMAMRAITNKMILIVIILFELGILGGVTYWKFFSGKKKD